MALTGEGVVGLGRGRVREGMSALWSKDRGCGGQEGPGIEGGARREPKGGVSRLGCGPVLVALARPPQI